MSKISLRPMVTVLALLCAVATLGFPTAYAETMSGDKITATVVFVDAQTGLLWLRNPDGQITKIAASTQLLDDLQKGDRVEVAITDQRAQSRIQAPSGDTTTAEVKEVTQEPRLVNLLTEQGEIFAMEPAQGQLAGLQPGDRVTVGVHKIRDAQSTSRVQQRQAQREETRPARDGQQPGPAIEATVTNIDTQDHMLTLQMSEGNTVELRVSEQMSAALQSGDTVEVSIRKP